MLPLPQKTLEPLLVGAGDFDFSVETPLLLLALLLQHVVVARPAALELALLPHLEAPRGALVGLHLRHFFLHVSSVYTCEEARGTGVEAVSPLSIVRLVYQTVAYLRAVLSLRPFGWGLWVSP